MNYIEIMHDILISAFSKNVVRYGVAHTSFCGLLLDFIQSCADYLHITINEAFAHWWHHNDHVIVTFCVALAGTLWYIDRLVDHREKKVKKHVMIPSAHVSRRIRH